MTLSGATTTGQIEPGTNKKEGLLHILQRSKTGTSPSECLMSYANRPSGEFYPSTEMQPVYPTALADWAKCSFRII